MRTFDAPAEYEIVPPCPPQTNVGMYRNRLVLAVRVRPARNAVLAAACVLSTGAVTAPATPHPFRLSVADVGVTETGLQARIRFFWDDLQYAVMERTSNMEFQLAENEEVDAIIETYINDMLVLEAGETALRGEVTARGVEDAARIDEVMWWYRLEYSLPSSAERVGMRNRLLFNMFEDQRNIVNLKTRSGRERTYYFSWDEDNITIPIG